MLLGKGDAALGPLLRQLRLPAVLQQLGGEAMRVRQHLRLGALLRERDRLTHAAQSAVGIAEIPQHAEGFPPGVHSVVPAEERPIRHPPLWIVQSDGALEVLVTRPQLAEVKEARPQGRVRAVPKGRVAAPISQAEEFFSHLPRGPHLPPDDVVAPQPECGRDQLNGVAELLAELSRPLHAARRLGVRVPLRDSQRVAEPKLQRELETRAFSGIR